MRVTGPVTLATRNAGKLAELQALCRGVLDLRLLPSDPAPPDVEEDQDSYLGNALKKARAIAAFTGGAALADDSGLEVDALPGELGVRSARYGEPGLDDAGRCARLVAALRGVAERSARFRCVLVLAQGDAWVSAERTLEGEIADAPRGSGGFGYDPVFVLRDRGQYVLHPLKYGYSNDAVSYSEPELVDALLSEGAAVVATTRGCQ